VRRGGITNHRLIAYSLSNISAKNYENRLVCCEVIVCYISVVFLRHSVHPEFTRINCVQEVSISTLVNLSTFARWQLDYVSLLLAKGRHCGIERTIR